MSWKIGASISSQTWWLVCTSLISASYGDSEPDPSILNVGWLSRAYPYTQGTVSELFVARLLGLVQSP
jgi:hypothetical protein